MQPKESSSPDGSIPALKWDVFALEPIGQILRLGPAALPLAFSSWLASLSFIPKPLSLLRGESDASFGDPYKTDGMLSTSSFDAHDSEQLEVHAIKILCGYYVPGASDRSFPHRNTECLAIMQQLSPWLLPLLARASASSSVSNFKK